MFSLGAQKNSPGELDNFEKTGIQFSTHGLTFDVKQWRAAIFRLCEVTWPFLSMHKQNNQLSAIHFNFDCIFIGSSVESNWFCKKYVQFAMKMLQIYRK